MNRIRTSYLKSVCCFLFALVLSQTVIADEDNETAVASAMNALDKFMLAFNNRDIDAWTDTLNFPHVRFASGTVNVYDNPKPFKARPVFKTLEQSGWDHSHWLTREVVLASAGKVHIATVFQRFNKSNEPIGTYESLYIVTKVNGRWGVQARSSLAP